MDIERLKKMSKAVYLACEEPVADDISDGIKWAINRIKELEAENERLKEGLSNAYPITDQEMGRV